MVTLMMIAIILRKLRGLVFRADPGPLDNDDDDNDQVDLDGDVERGDDDDA